MNSSKPAFGDRPDDCSLLDEVGVPTSRDEIQNNAEQVREIAEAIRAGKTLGKWRANQLDRTAELLERAYLFMPERGIAYKAGEKL